MALIGTIPDHWIGKSVDIALPFPEKSKQGDINFPCFTAKLLAQSEHFLELQMGDKVRLYPRSGIAYMAKQHEGGITIETAIPASGSGLIVDPKLLR